MTEEPRIDRTIASVTIPAAYAGEIEEYLRNIIAKKIKELIDREADRLVKGDWLSGVEPIGILVMSGEHTKTKAGGG